MKLPKQVKPVRQKVDTTVIKGRVKSSDWDPACVARCDRIKDEQGRYICLNYCPQRY
jgi:hypothetical protein